MMNENRWYVSYGIHRGTLMSRDTATEWFDTESDAREYYHKVVDGYQPGRDRFGYVLWFASLHSPDGKQAAQTSGYPYS